MTSESPCAHFEPRCLEDIHFEASQGSFERVDALSRQLDRIYSAWTSPLVRAWVTPIAAHLLEQWHPMRTSRMAWSDQAVPALALLPWLARGLKDGGAEDSQRDTNPWYRMERTLADSAERAIESWRITRDLAAELMFERMYPA